MTRRRKCPIRIHGSGHHAHMVGEHTTFGGSHQRSDLQRAQLLFRSVEI